jgi:hypothetical protein
MTSKQNTVLAKVIEKAPSEAREKLQEALRRSEDAHGRALSLREKMQEMEKPNTQSAIPGPGGGKLLYSEGNETGMYDGAASGNGSAADQQHVQPGEKWYGSH